MPTTPVYALRYPASTDPANVPSDIGNLASDVEKVLGGALSATPPASPVTGQLWAFPADATNGIVWLFRYNAASASTYKWEFVGGPDMISFINTNESTASASAADLTTVGPSITLARAGDYEIAWGAVAYNTVTPATQHMVLNTTGNPETVFTPPAANAFVSIGSGYRPINGIGAGSLVKAQYFTSTGTASFLYRYLNIRPVRVS